MCDIWSEHRVDAPPPTIGRLTRLRGPKGAYARLSHMKLGWWVMVDVPEEWYGWRSESKPDSSGSLRMMLGNG